MQDNCTSGLGLQNYYSFTYSQVRNCIQAALGHLNIVFKFDINEGPEVINDQGRLSLLDNKGLPISSLKRNAIPPNTLILAPMSLVMRHWSLLIYYNEQVFAYIKKICLKYAVNKIFGAYLITMVKNRHHQRDDFACGSS
jgi:hypothetical protein